MYLSDLQSKDIVSSTEGKNLGRIVDVEIDEDGHILNFVVEKRRFFRLFSHASEIKVSIKSVETVGQDVILIKNF